MGRLLSTDHSHKHTTLGVARLYDLPVLSAGHQAIVVGEVEFGECLWTVEVAEDAVVSSEDQVDGGVVHGFLRGLCSIRRSGSRKAKANGARAEGEQGKSRADNFQYFLREANPPLTETPGDNHWSQEGSNFEGHKRKARVSFQLSEQLNPIEIDIPILQAPIGSCAGPDLAVAVAEAGGLGALALTWASPGEAKTRVQDVLRRTARPFQVNFVLAFEPVALGVVLETGVRIVTFSWGHPNAADLALVRSFGAQLGVQVSTRDGAKRALDSGADFLICQGNEAGGHVQSTQPLRIALPQVIDEAAGTQVIATGGIASGAGIAEVIRMGAHGAMLGTRFVASCESLAHSEYKRMIVEASPEDAVLTLCFDIGWPFAPHRVIRNRTVDAWESAGCPKSPHRPDEEEVVAIRGSGVPVKSYEDMPALNDMSGRVTELSLYAGRGVGDIHEIMPADEIVSHLWNECQLILDDAHPFERS